MLFRLTRGKGTSAAMRLHPLAKTQRGFLRSLVLLPPTQKNLKMVKGWSTVLNIIAGAYFGGLAICGGLLYWMYQDANDRQPIPFEMSFSNQFESVRAINKDDVLRSPMYAEKHYRKVLQEIGQQEPENNVNLEHYDASDKYDFPIIKSNVLLKEKSSSFANFYIDMIARYAQALIAKNETQTSIKVLKKIVDDDELFFAIGDSESLSKACLLLAKLDLAHEEHYIKRSIDMLVQTHAPFLQIDENYLISAKSKVTNQFMASLNQLAFFYAANHKSKLNDALNIYLSNLNVLKDIETNKASGKLTKKSFPIFDISDMTMLLEISALKAHISEILWAKGYRKEAILWSEEVVDMVYDYHNKSSAVAPLLLDTLGNLSTMYNNTKDPINAHRCDRMQTGLEVYQNDQQSWHDETLARFSKIIYFKGPLGIIEKAINERYGKNKAVANLEDFDLLD